MTEAEYRVSIRHLQEEILRAIAVFYSLDELELLALSEPQFLKTINEDADFWMLHQDCLQTALFVRLNRIFDHYEGSGSVSLVMNATLDHIEYFSKDALAARQKDSKLVEAAWVPTEPADLRHLKKALKPHAARVREDYLPIRHQYYAHRAADHWQSTVELFKKTNREEIAETLDFLHDLADALLGLYQNGEEPRLGARDYTEHNGYHRRQLKRVLKKIPVVSE